MISIPLSFNVVRANDLNIGDVFIVKLSHKDQYIDYVGLKIDIQGPYQHLILGSKFTSDNVIDSIHDKKCLLAKKASIKIDYTVWNDRPDRSDLAPGTIVSNQEVNFIVARHPRMDDEVYVNLSNFQVLPWHEGVKFLGNSVGYYHWILSAKDSLDKDAEDIELYRNPKAE